MTTAGNSWLVVAVLTLAGCTGSAYDLDQSKDLPLDDSGTLSSQEESNVSTGDEADAEQNGEDTEPRFSIDVGDKGVDVEVGEVDVEVDSDDGVRVDVGPENEESNDQEPISEE